MLNSYQYYVNIWWIYKSLALKDHKHVHNVLYTILSESSSESIPKNLESSELHCSFICSSSPRGEIGKTHISLSVSCGVSSFVYLFSKGNIVSGSDFENLSLLSSCSFWFCLVPSESFSSFSCSSFFVVY